MNETKTILVPIDFSDCATDVVHKASETAKEIGARLVLMHVLQLPEGLDLESPVPVEGKSELIPAIDHLRQDAKQRMPAYEAQARERGVDVEVRIEEGKPVEEIVHAAKELRSERIIMGTHGRKGLSRVMLGSIADKVKKQAPCPVETVATVYKSHCKAGSCAWCSTHDSPALLRLRTEQSG